MIPAIFQKTAEAYECRRYLVCRDGHGGWNYEAVPDDASVVSPSDEVNVYTFLREFLPVRLLPMALKVIAERSCVAMKHGPKGAPMPTDIDLETRP